MMIDANTCPSKKPITCEFLIIGGGLAGLSLCHSLLKKGYSVTILESGGASTENDFAKKLNYGRGCLSDHLGQQRPLDCFVHESRYRGLGGSGHLWGGKCAELDPIDFVQRSWLPHSGWPMSYDEMKPYFNRACELLQIPYFTNQPELPDSIERRPLKVNNERIIKTGERCFTALSGRDHPVRFQNFIDQISQHHSANIYLHCTVTEIHADSASKRIHRIKALNYQHQVYEFISKHVVLAAGGLENSRLLLQARAQETIPKHWLSDTLGLFFMSHVMHTAPNTASQALSFHSKVLPETLQYYVDKSSNQQHGVFQLTKHYQRKNRLRNSLLSFQRSESVTVNGDQKLQPYFMVEQEPNPQSLVQLTSSGLEDQFGTPRLQLNWQLTLEDLTAIPETIKHYQNELEKHQLAQLNALIELDSVLQNIETTRHHIGTTRMSKSPTDGVVDEKLKVHGIENLFITGTSVFPTSGVANPTLCIVALSLRLADDLHTKNTSI